MIKKLSVILIMIAIVLSAIIITETFVFSKECSCFSGSYQQVRIVCVNACKRKIDGGCSYVWAEDSICSGTSDICRTKWSWECANSTKHGNVYFYKPCPKDCP